MPPRRVGSVAYDDGRKAPWLVAYDLPGLDAVEGIRRVLDNVVADALGLDNGIPRLRVLIAVATASTRLLETAELEARITALEAALRIERLRLAAH